MGSLTNLTEDETWLWHAYTYGFRRATMNSLERGSPIDPSGQWYDEHLAWNAEQFYRKSLGKGVRHVDERYAAAMEWRQWFAEEHGFRDFSEVMQYGILRAWNRLSTAPSPSREQDDLC